MICSIRLTVVIAATFFLVACGSENAQSAPPTDDTIQSLAEAGDASAQFNLGFMYGKGIGVPQNDTEAVKWYRLAAEQGVASAQYNLALMYDNGKGVPQDYAEAVKWYRLAAEQGDATAQYNLGVMYANGEGVPQDDAEAYVWFSLAAASGDADAVANRDIVSKKLPAEALVAAQQRATKLFEEIEARKSR